MKCSNLWSLEDMGFLFCSTIDNFSEAGNVDIRTRVEITSMNHTLKVMMEFPWAKETTWKLLNRLAFHIMLATGINTIHLIFRHQLSWREITVLPILIRLGKYHSGIGVQVLEQMNSSVLVSWVQPMQQTERRTVNIKTHSLSHEIWQYRHRFYTLCRRFWTREELVQPIELFRQMKWNKRNNRV